MRKFTIETTLNKSVDSVFAMLKQQSFYEKIGEGIGNSTYMVKSSRYDEINKTYLINAQVRTKMDLDNILNKLIDQNLIFERSDKWTEISPDLVEGSIEYDFNKPLTINVIQKIQKISESQAKLERVYTISYAFPILKNKIESFVEANFKSACEEELILFSNIVNKG